VIVKVEPLRVAGPDVTKYVIAPDDAEEALTENGETPYAWFAIGTKANVGTSGDTTKLVIAVAPRYVLVAAWLAIRTTVPTPVIVRPELETLAGPEITEYVIAPLDADVALTVKGATPYVLVGIAEKLSVGVGKPEVPTPLRAML
jgi:N-acetylmuramic acid 6-phosphate (MurNAc-6-P) etherase